MTDCLDPNDITANLLREERDHIRRLGFEWGWRNRSALTLTRMHNGTDRRLIKDELCNIGPQQWEDLFACWDLGNRVLQVAHDLCQRYFMDTEHVGWYECPEKGQSALFGVTNAPGLTRTPEHMAHHAQNMLMKHKVSSWHGLNFAIRFEPGVEALNFHISLEEVCAARRSKEF